MNEVMLTAAAAGEQTGTETYEGLSEQLEWESLRYCRALSEEEEARAV